MSTNRLLFTAQQRAAARNMRCVGYVVMTPFDFLRLTMPPGASVAQWIQANQRGGRLQSLEQYNQYTRERSNTQMPWLTVRLDGKVLEHEGRHRAAAVHVAGGRVFPVALHLLDGTRHVLDVDKVPAKFIAQSNDIQTYKFDASAFTSFGVTSCLIRIQHRLHGND